MASDLCRLSAEEVAASVRSGKVSALEVVNECLALTEETVEPAVHAYLTLFADEARETASAIDRRRRAGEDLGVLAGVPIALKDNLSVAGQPCTCGSKILAGYSATFTSTAAQRVLDAGAVVVGRTNLDEFAMGSSCENSAYGVTRNPWNTDRVPGGSSGGSAAAVASCSVPLALGSDTGGSIRQPAAFCGVVGLKPTYGRVSRSGLVAFASSLDQIGPLSRTVRDAAVGLSVIAGPDPADPTCSPIGVDDLLAHIEDGLQGVRVGVVREMDTSEAAEDVRGDWQDSLRRLEEGGAEIREVSVPHVTSSIALYYVIANSEASANLSRFDGLRYGHRSSAAATLTDLYEESREEGFGPEVKRRILLGTFALSSGYYDAYYGKARGVLQVLKEQFRAAFEDVDVIVSPTSPTSAFRIGEMVDDPLRMYLQDIYTTAASLVGLPAIAVPSGLDSRGMPLSLQIMGRAFEESTVLRVARDFEKAVDREFIPPLIALEHAS